ncbi:unnamed protein product, partial [Phaeothamnion confervicola]
GAAAAVTPAGAAGVPQPPPGDARTEALLRAVRSNDVATLRALLYGAPEAGAPAAVPPTPAASAAALATLRAPVDTMGHTLLHVAVMAGAVEAITLLVDPAVGGPLEEGRAADGKTALHLAADSTDKRVVAALLNAYVAKFGAEGTLKLLASEQSMRRDLHKITKLFGRPAHLAGPRVRNDLLAAHILQEATGVTLGPAEGVAAAAAAFTAAAAAGEPAPG